MYCIALFFKHHLFEFILLLNVLQIIFKTIIFKGLFVFILEALHFYFGFILSFVCSCFGFFLFHEVNIFFGVEQLFFFVLAKRWARTAIPQNALFT